MMGSDQLIERVRTALRESPAVTADPRAAGRVLAAVWASPRPSPWRRVAEALRMTTFTRLGVVSVAAAALVAGFVFRGAVRPAAERAPLATATPAPGVPVVPASIERGEVAAVAMQFVFDAADARSVSLVGDFNQWKAGETPLVRLPNGLWTVTVPLPPGRHVYAFVRDDTLFVADPRAPRSGDEDFGREGSVVMVFAR